MVSASNANSNVTLKMVADRAGVHTGTASRALNPATRDLVNEVTRQKVRRAASALSYQPNRMAQGLKTNRTMMVGIIVPDLTNPLFPPIVRGAEAELARSGYIALMADTDNNLDRERERLEALQARQVDGLIVASAHRNDSAVQKTAQGGTPMVLINRRVDQWSLPVVMGDDANGVEQAVRHLTDLGHKTIGHLAGPSDVSTGHSRTRAFKAAMADFGHDLAANLTVECNTYSVEEGARSARVLLDQAHPSAVLAGNDQLAVGLLDVLRERGLQCPDDVSVVGFNDMPFVDKLSPSLTTIRVPHGQIGTESARILLREMTEDSTEVNTISLGVSLQARGSTGPPRR